MKQSILDIPLDHQFVLVRVDFNVPLKSDGTIADDNRIKACLPTLIYLHKMGFKVIIMSHLGNPKGSFVPLLSLKKCAERLSDLLCLNVDFIDHWSFPQIKETLQNMRAGGITMLENLRFAIGEENPEKDPTFYEQLASLTKYYVNEAFAASHRKHASLFHIPQLLQEKAFLGLLFEKEVSALSSLLHNPSLPFQALIGGSKISSKIGTIKSLIKQVDSLFVGGAMCFTFLKSQGYDIGDSMYESEQELTALEILQTAHSRKTPLFLPLDFVCYHKIENKIKIFNIDEGIPEGWAGMDIGPKTCSNWQKELTKAKTIFWNGPMGVFEKAEFQNGTLTIGKILCHLKNAKVVIGGGDSVAAIYQLGLSEKFFHISTGGGACLEFIEHGSLPGWEVILQRFFRH